MKEKFAAALPEILAFIAIFFAALQGALLALGFLIMIDTFTGIWASVKSNGVKSVTSRKAGRIVTKLVLYPLAIVVAKVAEDYLVSSIPIVEVTTGILAVVEVKSIFENMGSILGFDLWQRIKKVLWKDKVEE